MTAPRTPVAAKLSWYARPAIVLPIVAALIILSALATPTLIAGRGGDQRLSTYSADPMGGRIFHDVARRLGWDVEQRRVFTIPADSNTVFAELDPAVSLRPVDVHALLEHARNGGALVAMLGDGSRLLADSLRVRLGRTATLLHVADGATAGCTPDSKSPLDRRFFYTLWPGDRVTLTTLTWRGKPRDSVTTFIETDLADNRRGVTTVGFDYGRGRIVVGADPDVLRNDAIRVCKYGLDVAAVRMLEFLGDHDRHPRNRIVFDEFHQGYGEQHGTTGAIADYLVGIGSGRLLLQLLAAGLVLLLAAAPRAIPPYDPERVERRSPLEHVDALGRAYAQVGATRSATARLVRGVRRRLAGGAMRSSLDPSDDAFLDRALRDQPRLAAEVALIKSALHAPVSRRDFASVGAALEKLELSLTRI